MTLKDTTFLSKKHCTLTAILNAQTRVYCLELLRLQDGRECRQNRVAHLVLLYCHPQRSDSCALSLVFAHLATRPSLATTLAHSVLLHTDSHPQCSDSCSSLLLRAYKPELGKMAIHARPSLPSRP